ncbi:glucose-1-phosphate thymidylyltransferase RfbA [Maridesulfovibrio hydrothermalis]|uniref:Glucose-1-phosphate thymidylyltransferase n=1 Tax=Maridesulfovibrio hydrothermalis AM13 = DSM 14728 TaxID=1121451 RepID=L0RDX6_9BACT|nr:glucose-1-phosphate thymidylyltransferase RfbA [Maridesulfovibrio hydrothermalis]CCO24988.1 glucose-1-phosphate thymidylyltransferase [Maridesulfovibrio hydrothermalis AM13 = DSM 14728]
MKGIILAGGSGTRLYPLTRVVSKQLLPVYDKPMIYYPLSIHMMSGIKDIMIISTPEDLHRFEDLLGDGASLGINISYKVQPKPEGLAQAFIIAEDFIGEDNVSLILGDNIFYGHDLPHILQKTAAMNEGGTVFAYAVKNPKRYGVVEFDKNQSVISIEEKPDIPKSKFAVTGLYFYDNSVIEIAKKIKPSPRGELEITDVNNEYLKQGKLNVELLGRGYAWLDMGTHESLLRASAYVEAIQERQGVLLACLEEIAFKMGYITAQELKDLAADMLKNDYGKYIMDIYNESKAD